MAECCSFDQGLASHTANASAGIRHPFRFDPAILHTKLVARIAAVQQFRALIQRYRPSDSIEIEYSAITRLVKRVVMSISLRLLPAYLLLTCTLL